MACDHIRRELLSLGCTLGHVYSEVVYDDEDLESCVYVFYKLAVISEYAEFNLFNVVAKKHELVSSPQKNATEMVIPNCGLLIVKRWSKNSMTWLVRRPLTRNLLTG